MNDPIYSPLLSSGLESDPVFLNWLSLNPPIDPATVLKLDQTTPQTIVGGTEINNKTLNQIITDTKLFAIAMATAL